MRLIAGIVVGCCLWLLSGCAGAAGGGPAAGETGFERVEIPLVVAVAPDAAGMTVIGYLFRPEGGGRFPAVVIMHGCNGLDWAVAGQPGWLLAKSYAERYVRHGYVALVLDSFAPRGIGNACGKPLTVSAGRRAADAYSAAAYLAAKAFVDRDRIVLQGDSHGGWTTLVALETGGAAMPVHFAAGIAWYPACYRARGFSAPLLILIGTADDWTPAAACTTMSKRLGRNGHGADIVLKIFPGATHAFDFPLPPRTNYLGHHLAYDRQATEASWQAIDAFLQHYVRSPG